MEATRSARVSGPRELLSITWWPAAANRTASACPMLPAPMIPDPHATFQLAALHHGPVAGCTASCRLASGKGAPAMPETVDVIVLALETVAEGFLAALEQRR